MKRRIYAVMAVCTLAAGTAQAVTVDDLLQHGGNAIEIAYGNHRQQSLHDNVNGLVTIEKLNDSTVVLKNFLGICDVPFILKGDRLVMDRTDLSYNTTNVLRLTSPQYAVVALTPQQAEDDSYYDIDGLRYSSDEIKGDGGEYTITFNMPVKIECFNGSNGRYFEAMRAWKNRYTIEVFKPNANVADYNKTAGQSRTYGAKIAFEGNSGKFAMVNFGARGYGIENYMVDSTLCSRLNKLTGTFDRASGKAWMDSQQLASDLSPMTDYGTVDVYRLCGIDTASGSARQQVEGTVRFSGQHHTGTSAWVTDGGDCRTLETAQLEFNPWSAYCDELGSTGSQPVVTDTRITVPEHDVTLGIKFTDAVGRAPIGSSQISVEASWKALANEWLVDSYDLLMVEGNPIEAADVQLDKATTVASGIAKNDDGQYTVSATVASHFVDDFGTLPRYTMMVRANYDPATGLTPTLHCLCTVDMLTTMTGVDNVETAKEVKSVTYFNAAGAVVPQPVAGGVYVKVTTYTDGSRATVKTRN